MSDGTAVDGDIAGLLARAGLGDRAAFAALYRRTSARLFGVIVRINPDRAQAEDVLQEVYVNVWHGAAGFDAALASPLTWMTRIARNAAIDSLRRVKARVQTTSSTVATPDGEETDLAEQQPDEGDGPLELLQQAVQRRHVERCVGRLSFQQQQCIALAYYQGLSHGEVATHLAEPLGTVKSWLRRALQSLRDCLDH